MISWTTLVVHSRDDEDKESDLKVKPATIFLDDDGAVKTKPKQAFRSTWNTFNKLLQNFKNYLFYGIFYWLTACLPYA